MSTTLYFREGTSDKVYRVAIEQRDGGYEVTFAYGRRGSTMTTGTKTTTPVSFDEAHKIFTKLVKEKQAKGYTEGVDGVPYTGNGQERSTGIQPQLLNPVDEDQINGLLESPDFYLQQKYDGRRLLLRKRGEEITGINRRGFSCGIPTALIEAAEAIDGDFLIDGEVVSDRLFAFDMLECDGTNLREEAYSNRLVELLNVLFGSAQYSIRWVEPWIDPFQKRKRFEELRYELAEGVVFKNIHAPFRAGRPHSGGAQLKYKFVETASCIVTGINSKRSVALGFLDGQTLVTTGNVAIPADKPVPCMGDIVEVRYLYAMPDSGALYQPVYLGTRDDVGREECVIGQLKFRREAEMEAA